MVGATESRVLFTGGEGCLLEERVGAAESRILFTGGDDWRYEE